MSEAALRRWWPHATLGLALAVTLLWGAFAPMRYASRDQLFEIPKGTYDRRMHGEQVEILPALVTLTLGVQDVLLLRNRDRAPHVFGQVRVAPGHAFRLPFEQAGDYEFNCSAHANGQMIVRVVAEPDPGWNRLSWRARKLLHDLRYLPLIGPA